MWNKVLSNLAGLGLIVGFFMMVGVAGASDYAIEIGEYLPWYYGWQYLVIGLVLMACSAFILSRLEIEWEDYDEDF